MIEKKASKQIILIGVYQIITACYLFYIIYLKIGLKTPFIITLAVSLYIIHLILSAINFLKLEPHGRISTMTNLLVFSIFSLGGIFLIGTRKPLLISFWLAIFLISLYFIYFLTRPNIKLEFRGRIT